MVAISKNDIPSPQTSRFIWQLPIENQPIRDSETLRDALFAVFGVKKGEQDDYLAPDYDGLHSPAKLGGIKPAVVRIGEAIESGEKIAIYGDYDIDGITATTLLLDVMTQLNANVAPYIPDRFEEGYGLNSDALARLKKSGVGLVVSVDCGITAAKEVSEARAIGLDCIITDHHTVPSEIPDQAIACINPRITGDSYPFKDLAGVGVAFKLACALAEKYPQKIKRGHEKWLLDLVALGTVCDVVPLIAENRALVQFGLTVLRKSSRVGLRALAAVSGTDLEQVIASDLGFRFGPRLNAAGRLEHAAKALELLTTKDRARADEIAHDLDALNRKRQAETKRMSEEALLAADSYSDDPTLVLSSPKWSHGIVGLVASRVSEASQKPTILFQDLGMLSKGSARSVGGFNIIEAIGGSADLLERYGGHAFAAGMTIKTANIKAFRKSLNDYARKNTEGLARERLLVIAAVVSPELLTIDAVRGLARFEPFGNSNLQPSFMSQLTITRFRPVGVDLSHLQLTFLTPKGEISAIAFGAAVRWTWLEPGMAVEVAYRLSINTWQGNQRPQLDVIDMRPLSASTAVTAS